MRVLLIILCGIMLLFSGGCVLLLGVNVGPLSLLPLGVAVLNGFVLAAIFGWAKAPAGIFHSLVVLDAIVVVALGIALASWSASDPSVLLPGLLLMAGFAAKGFLTWAYLQSSGRGGGS